MAEKTKELLIEKKKINKLLPDNLELDKDVVINRWKWFDYEPCALALFNKNGSHRVAKSDTEKVKQVLEEQVGYKWYKDTVSNFVLHCDLEKT